MPHAIRFALLVLLALAGWPQIAAALVVAPPALNPYTSAPVDDPGWNNVGDRGVYLGNGWVLSAFHVGAGTTSFAGIGSFAAVPGSTIRIENPTGQDLSAFTDLILYRLATAPSLPPLSIAATAPGVGSLVTYISDGRSAGPLTPESHWNVTGPSNNPTWTSTLVGGDQHGYFSGPGGTKQWGTNVVEDDEPYTNDNDAGHQTIVSTSMANGHVISLITDFDNPGVVGSGATAAEAQAQGGDSGGAVFYKDGDSWVLAGITHAVSTFTNQPANTAVYGNLTLFADLSAYRSQIVAITAVPEASSLLLLSAVVAANLVWRYKRQPPA